LGLDLRNVPVPDGNDPFERWAVPIVRESIQRIARIHANAHARAKDDVFATFGGTGDIRFPQTDL